MGLFTPKYPAGAEPPRKESRGARKDRESSERIDRQLADDFKSLHRDSKERTARFWTDYEQQNGRGSVDWS